MARAIGSAARSFRTIGANPVRGARVGSIFSAARLCGGSLRALTHQASARGRRWIRRSRRGTLRARTMDITPVLTAPRSPWHNGAIARFIGSVRRECLDHLIVECRG
jgi:transposase InsO family protein